MSSEPYRPPMTRAEAIKSVAWGVAWVAGACCCWLHGFGNPAHSLTLILRGQTAPGRIVDAWEDFDQDECGRDHCYHHFSYTFCPAGGQQRTARTLPRSGRLHPEFVDLVQPVAIEVEYDPTDPSVSRIKGDGCQTVGDWLLADVCFGGVLLAIFASPGGVLIRSGVRAYQASPPT